MTKPALGGLVGAGLGLLDGLSARAYPEARAMIVSIVISSTVKGIVTGAATGWVARRWRSMAGGIAAGLLFLFPASVVGQQSTQPDPFGPIAVLLGRWEGTSEGQPGKAQVQREYRRVLNSRFIHARNRSEYAPQEKNPKGKIHEDEGWFSFDGARKRLVLRQFHVEGFVNQYVQDADSSDSKLVFTTEAIENIPVGWRARETYIVHGPDEFEEVFELAEAGKPFELYSRARLKRVK